MPIDLVREPRYLATCDRCLYSWEIARPDVERIAAPKDPGEPLNNYAVVPWVVCDLCAGSYRLWLEGRQGYAGRHGHGCRLGEAEEP